MSGKVKPNILWIGTDEHHRGTIGAYGSVDCKTPSIDTLAQKSMVFDCAFSPTAVCAPARASILSGRLPSEGSVISNDFMEFTLPHREIGDYRPLHSWVHALQESGYTTAHVGKWHVSPDCKPSDYGFEGPDWPGYGNVEKDFHRYRADLGLSPKPEFEDEMPAKHPFGSPFDPIAARLVGPEEGSLPAFVAHTAINYLEKLGRRYRESGNPFFLRCEFWGPHISCIVPEPYYSMYNPETVHLPGNFGVLGENKPEVQTNFSGGWGIATYSEKKQREFISKYLGYVSCIDAQVGKILQTLETLKLDEETLVIFTSDHGDMLGAHGLYDKGPFMYDDIYRVPLIVRWPSMIKSGRNDSLVYNMDMGATMWELAAKKVPAGGSAKSLLPVLTGEKEGIGRDSLFCEFYRQWDFFPQVMVHTGTDKFIYNFGGIDEYYNLKTDPYEMNNRIYDKQVRKRIEYLRGKLHRWMKKINSPMLHGFERTWVSKTRK